MILSYILARNDGDPGRDAREALVYYAQNAKPILKTSVWVVIQERVLSFPRVPADAGAGWPHHDHPAA